MTTENIYKLNPETNQLSLDYSLKHPSIQIDKEKNLIEVTEGKAKKIGKAILIKEIRNNIETEEMTYDIEIHTFDSRKIEVKGLERYELLNGENILEFMKYGAEVNRFNRHQYIKSFENQERIIMDRISTYHNKLGWLFKEGEEIYRHKEAVGTKSIYQGEKDLGPKGSWKGYKEILENEVIGQVELEGIIAVGLSAVVIGYIGKEIGVSSQLVHIYGNSSTGKSTVGELAISLAGNPNLQVNGLANSWNSTNNALLGSLRDNMGCPILIDDSSVGNRRDYSQLLYQIVEGRDKARMNKEGDLREARIWQTTVISTGEESLRENSNQNDGIKARVLEFNNIPWTKDAPHSERIKKGCRKNYGFAVTLVAERLIELGKEESIKRIEKIRKRMLEKLEKKGKRHPLYPRITTVASTNILALELFKEKTELNFNLEGVEEFILENLTIKEGTMGNRAYEDILEYVTSNINRFYTNLYQLKDCHIEELGEIKDLEKRQKAANTNTKILGKVEDVDYRIEKRGQKKGEASQIVVTREIMILRNEFSKVLKDMGYNNPTGILREWKEKDLINCERDRYTRKRKLTPESSVSTLVVIKTQEKYEIELKSEEQSFYEAVGIDPVDEITAEDIEKMIKGE